jgi:hypothetical protein
MRRSNWTPSIVPSGYDQTVYLVADNFGIAVLAAANTMLRSHSPATDRSFSASDMTSLQSRTVASANKLPVEEFEDMSLIFSTAPKR